MASLTVLKGMNPGQRINLDGDLFVMGRKPECQIHIQNNAVSREHARITRAQNLFYIEDLESRNGTWVNNVEIVQKTQLKDSDRIKICDCLFTFHQETPPSSDIEIEDDDTDSPSTVHASVGRIAQQQLLETQPSERLRALLDVSKALSKTLNEETLLPQIAEILFNVFKQADRCFVIIREETDGVRKLIPKVIKTRRANAETTARFSRTIVSKVLDSGQSLLFDDAQSSAGPMSLSASIAEFRIRSVMCAPLMNQDGNAYGLIQLDSQDRNKAFTEDDLGLLVGVANQAAIALDNARLHQLSVEMALRQKDEQLATDVQRSFLPASLPNIAGYQFYAFYQAAKNVGGDYYDFVPHHKGQLAVLLGDVAGKGMPAALLMAKLSAEARYCLLIHQELPQAIGRLNEQLLQAGMMDRFVTLSSSLLDSNSHTVTIVNAGHESPLVYRHATNTLEVGIPLDLCGFPLGMIEGTAYDCNTITLNAGDCLIIFTDGVTDALNLANASFGMERTRAAILGNGSLPESEFSAPAIGKRLIAAVQAHAAGQYQNDDIALVCFGRLEDLIDLEPESGRIATATGPLTQSVKRQKREKDD